MFTISIFINVSHSSGVSSELNCARARSLALPCVCVCVTFNLFLYDFSAVFGHWINNNILSRALFFRINARQPKWEIRINWTIFYIFIFHRKKKNWKQCSFTRFRSADNTVNFYGFCFCVRPFFKFYFLMLFWRNWFFLFFFQFNSGLSVARTKQKPKNARDH